MDLEKILDYLVENNIYVSKINNITIFNNGIRENTTEGRREVFTIERKVDKKV